jgi:hypothetical protein
MDSSCPDYTKLDGEFEDDGDHKPLECGEYKDPYGDDDDELVDQTNQERTVICATDLMNEKKRKEENKCL